MPAYQPTPIDTSNIVLPGSITPLLEKLAENTHEVWAKQRMNEGWTWGRQRDDSRKQHPGLVPYEQLSESEKDYDRVTASETLKVIIQLGYTLTPAR